MQAWIDEILILGFYSEKKCDTQVIVSFGTKTLFKALRLWFPILAFGNYISNEFDREDREDFYKLPVCLEFKL